MKQELQPQSCAIFTMEFIKIVLLHQKPHLFSDLLQQTTQLGPNINGIMLIVKNSTEVCFLHWCHRTRRPLGHLISSSCPQCHAIEPWTLKKGSIRSIPEHIPNVSEGRFVIFDYKPKYY